MSSTIYYLLTENGTSGTYWAGLPTTDPGNGGNYRERYGNAIDGYRVYSNIYDLRSDLYLARDISKSVYVEVQGAWTDTSSNYLSNGGGSWRHNGYFSITFASIVNGVRDPDSFHHGIPGSGWRWISPSNYFLGFTSDGSRFVVDGLEAGTTFDYQHTTCFDLQGALSKVVNCIASAAVQGIGFNCSGMANVFANNIAVNVQIGFMLNNYVGDATVVSNNLAINCDTGFTAGSYANNAASVVNNISVNNTTNWGQLINGYCYNNAGESGDSPWDTPGNTAVTGVTTSVFVDYATNDFRLSAAATTLINAGTDLNSQVVEYDMLGNLRPNYEPSTYPDNKMDIGPFEYDHGNGLPPVEYTLTLSANVSLVGAEIRIYDLDGATGDFGTELAGTESHTSATYSYTDTTTNLIHIQIMLDGYEEFNLDYTLDSDVTLPITLNADNNA